MADPAAIAESVNAACRARGGAHAQYSCKRVSWDDVARGTQGGALSCWGANITDTRLYAKDGRALWTLRSDNWNEKLGRVKASEVALLAGNHAPGAEGGALTPRTLSAFLAALGTYGAYAGLPAGTALGAAALDDAVSIRFQTVFLPVADDTRRGALQFTPECYNYQTTSAAEPKNLLLLCTTQGTAVQADGPGAQRLYHHAVDAAGDAHLYWLEAERSEHAVGGAQAESHAERAEAAARGKATAAVIGTRAMGTRFNVLMTVQVPLKQTEKPPPRYGGFGLVGCTLAPLSSSSSVFPNMFAAAGCAAPAAAPGCAAPAAAPAFGGFACAVPRPAAARVGASNAARLSRGAHAGPLRKLALAAPPARHAEERITVTVVLYYTVAAGVPSAEDAARAVDDMEALYAACGAAGDRAAAPPLQLFSSGELTAVQAGAIAAKVVTQPYLPPPTSVANYDAFPADG